MCGSNTILGVDIIRWWTLLEVFYTFLSKITGAGIIRGIILLEGLRYSSRLNKYDYFAGYGGLQDLPLMDPELESYIRSADSGNLSDDYKTLQKEESTFENKWNLWNGLEVCQISENTIQGGPERSRQSNLAVFTIEGGLDSKFPYVR